MDGQDKDTNGGPPPQEQIQLSNGVVLNKDDKIPNKNAEQGQDQANEDENLNFNLKIYKNIKICIYKPLIPLKIALFCWFGAGAAVQTFLSVYFKQRGLTLAELSTVYIISPAIQFTGPTLSGVIADKLGRSKPVLVANVLLNVLVVVAMLLVPRMNTSDCEPHPINLKCHTKEFDRLIVKTRCRVTRDVFRMESCNVQCPENVTQYCHGRNLICDLLAGGEEFGNFSLAVNINGTFMRKNDCFYNVSSISHKNTTYSWCNVPHKMYCTISCILNPGEDCSAESSDRFALLIVNMVLLILFFTILSNCYRFMDVTSMALVKEHNGDFGRERFFSICGILVFAPISGLFVKALTPEGEEENYAVALYLFIIMCFVTLAVVYKLPVKLQPPGKKMLKKSLNLAKNPDIMAFTLTVLVLGTEWGFMKNFTMWYLEEMGGPSYLLGLVPAVGSLYGLPFLATSNWWVKKIGPTQIFVLGLLGYVVLGIGYSFMYDPWLALLLEATSVMTYHLLWVSVVIHSHSIAPEGLTATVISTAGALHYSIGKFSGSLVGGLIMDAFGGRTAYRVLAFISLAAAVMYGLFLYVRRTCYAKDEPQNGKDRVDNENPNCEAELEDVYRIQDES